VIIEVDRRIINKVQFNENWFSDTCIKLTDGETAYLLPDIFGELQGRISIAANASGLASLTALDYKQKSQLPVLQKL